MHGQGNDLNVDQADCKAAVKVYVGRLKNERSPQGYANLAGCLYKLGRLDYAFRYANYALELANGTCNPARLVLANIFVDSREENKAIRIYLKLVKTDVGIHALQGLAVVCQKRGNLKRAIRILALAAKAHPDAVAPHLALGTIYLEMKEHRQAWERFRKCLLIDTNFLDAWRGAYHCACALKKLDTALSIAQKLIEIDSTNPRSYEYYGKVLFELNQPKACGDAFAMALTLQPDNLIYYLNAANPCGRVPRLGVDVYSLLCSVKASCSSANSSLTEFQSRLASGNRGLMPFAYYCAYSPCNLKEIYGSYYSALERIYQAELNYAKTKGCELRNSYSINHSNNSHSCHAGSQGKIRVGLLSRYFSAHSNTQAFEGLIHYLDRDRFELVLIHRSATVVDVIQLKLNALADEVVYLWDSLEYSYALLQSLAIDILFFTDLGMNPYDFMIPALRICPIQVTGWGLPHTSGLGSIDYYLSSNLIESEKHQDEYVERLVLLDGLPCCFMAKNLSYRRVSRDYFMLPSDCVLLGCTQNFWKIHPDFDLIIEKIAYRLPDVVFVFVETGVEGSNQSFVQRVAKRAPRAYSRSIFLARASTADFLPLCDCLDVILDTPYYGAGVTAYMSMYVGAPTVCFSGQRLRDSTTAAIYRYLSIENAPIAYSVQDYIDHAINLANDFDLRLQIKKDTVAAAHRLYDNQEYVRSFEKFCFGLVDKSP